MPKVGTNAFDLLFDEGEEYPYAYLIGNTIDGKTIAGKDTVNLVQPWNRHFETIFMRIFHHFPYLFQILQSIS